jgi:hypothetical protein
VLDRVTSRPATSRPVAPILALLALATLLTGCFYHDGYPAVYGYGYYGGYGGGHHDHGWRDRWHRGGGYYGNYGTYGHHRHSHWR